MIITNQQRASFNTAAIDNFVVKTRIYVCAHYPEHALAKQIPQLDKKIREVLQFAFAHNIKSEINILNLIILLLDRPVGVKQSPEQLAILNHTKWHEDRRTEEYYLLTLLKS